MRNNLSVAAGSIPMPEHLLFSDQQEANETLLQTLSTEVNSAINLAKKVDSLAKDYRTACEVVKRGETLSNSARELTATFNDIIEKLTKGVSAGDADGLPPVLSSEICLDTSRYSVFLALLPSILESHSKADALTATLLQTSGSIIATLDLDGIDTTFQPSIVAAVNDLCICQERAHSVVSDVMARVNRLRDARKIWASLVECQRGIEAARRILWDALEKRKLQLSEQRNFPANPGKSLPVDVSVPGVEQRLVQLENTLGQDVESQFESVQPQLQLRVADWIRNHVIHFKTILSTTRQNIPLLDSLDKQTEELSSIRSEFTELWNRLGAMRDQVKVDVEDVLATRLANGDILPKTTILEQSKAQVEGDAKAFIDSLSHRISFVARDPDTYHVSTLFTERRFSLIEAPSEDVLQSNKMQLPFNLSDHDAAIRTECNNFVMKLNGTLDALAQAQAHLIVVCQAKELDVQTRGIARDIEEMEEEVQGLSQRLDKSREWEGDELLKELKGILAHLNEASNTFAGSIPQSLTEAKTFLSKMVHEATVQDASLLKLIEEPRSRTVTELEDRYEAASRITERLREHIYAAIKAQQEHSERLRIEKERRDEQERLRIIAEEKERERLEKEREEAETNRRLEALRIQEEQQREAERKRLAAEEAERLRLEMEGLEREEGERREAERLAAEQRLEAERARVIAEEAERLRLEKEKAEVERKLELMEEQLLHERRQQAEKERAAAEERDRLLSDAKEKERLRLESEKRAEVELREAVEKERARSQREKEVRDKEEQEREQERERERQEERGREKEREQEREREKEREQEREKERKRITEEKEAQEQFSREREAREDLIIMDKEGRPDSLRSMSQRCCLWNP